MKVLFLASEIFPFAKVGGLGDVAYALPKALKKLGVEVISAMPLYPSVNRQGIETLGKTVWVRLNNRLYPFHIYRKNDHVFFHNPDLFDREFIYGPPGKGYPDNDLRFGGFCWAVAEAIRNRFLQPDIIHANDWHTALYPVLHREVYRFPQKVVFTIHNLAFQGVFEKEILYRLHLPLSLDHADALEFKGKINLMKGGILYSDVVTTVSKTYAREILTPEYAYGLEEVLARNRHKLYGILNGIDEEWNPQTDPFIWAPYTSESLRNKAKNKRALLQELNAPVRSTKPLVSFVGRLAKQKGVELLWATLERLSHSDTFWVILGEGAYGAFFKDIDRRYPTMRSIIRFDEVWAHRLYAASDFVLLPSLFEPCGITQMIAMRYGSLVIARKTGGLADTVVDVSLPRGYGILFHDPTPDHLVCAIQRAFEVYAHKSYMRRLRKRVMKLDFSWNKSAKMYLDLYKKLLFKKPS